jgi:hypothetical protein
MIGRRTISPRSRLAVLQAPGTPSLKLLDGGARSSRPAHGNGRALYLLHRPHQKPAARRSSSPPLVVPCSKNVSDGQQFSCAEGYRLCCRIRVERAAEGFTIVLSRCKHLANHSVPISILVPLSLMLECNISGGSRPGRRDGRVGRPPIRLRPPNPISGVFGATFPRTKADPLMEFRTSLLCPLLKIHFFQVVRLR